MSEKTTPTPTSPGEAPDDPGRLAPERASGTIDRPIAPGDAQPGDSAERAAELGGPVDIFPTRRDRTGLEGPLSTDKPG